MPDMSEPTAIARLRRSARVWAVASVHGEASHLARLHEALAIRLDPGDRIVYLGNLLGCGSDPKATLSEAIRFRRAVIARPGGFAGDVVFLRGRQEEMWQKLLTLQLAPNPVDVLKWMLEQGAGATIAAYGGNPVEGLGAARSGAMAIARWTGRLREAFHGEPGHEALMAALKRAAVNTADTVLFVSAGIDVGKALASQADSFWWGATPFNAINAPFNGFRRIVRGFDHAHGGLNIGPVTASLDAGAGFGGPLLACAFDNDGNVLEAIEA
jgi:serine/threonine protein phosphatase 1